MVIFVLTNLLNSSLNLLLVIIKCLFKKKKLSHQGALGRLGGVVEVGEVHRPKESIRRDNRVEKNVDTGERSD